MTMDADARTRSRRAVRRLAAVLAGLSLLAVVGCAERAVPAGAPPDGLSQRMDAVVPATIPSDDPYVTRSSPDTDRSAASAPTSTSNKERRRLGSAKTASRFAPLAVEVNRTCLDRGDEFVVTVRTEKRASVGLAVGYSDSSEDSERIIPDYHFYPRDTNPTGTVTWSFVVRPSVPYGPAILKVLVSGSDGRGAHEEVDLMISPSCDR